MNQRKLFLQLLPGFVPLLVFIIVDEIWGSKIGLIAAIAMGIVELVWYWLKDKKFDKFILFDTLLIVALGVVSIMLENDVFFKIKPALIGLLLCVIIGVSVFISSNFLLNMTQRYMKGVNVSDEQLKLMKNSLKTIFWLFLGYTVLVFYSVWFLSNEAWAFISGGLFYILFGMYFLFTYVKTRLGKNNINNEEWLPLLNEKGDIVGKASRSICHSDKKYLHPVVHLHVLNSNGEFFLQKRPLHKVQPGKWDTAVGGHIAFGESVELSLQREALEEIGLKDFNSTLVANYIWESEIEREFVFCFITSYNGEITINKDELLDGKFWSITDIEKNLGKEIFTPNFEKEYHLIIKKYTVNNYKT